MKLDFASCNHFYICLSQTDRVYENKLQQLPLSLTNIVRDILMRMKLHVPLGRNLHIVVSPLFHHSILVKLFAKRKFRLYFFFVRLPFFVFFFCFLEVKDDLLSLLEAVTIVILAVKEVN